MTGSSKIEDRQEAMESRHWEVPALGAKETSDVVLEKDDDLRTCWRGSFDESGLLEDNHQTHVRRLATLQTHGRGCSSVQESYESCGVWEGAELSLPGMFDDFSGERSSTKSSRKGSVGDKPPELCFPCREAIVPSLLVGQHPHRRIDPSTRMLEEGSASRCFQT